MESAHPLQLAGFARRLPGVASKMEFGNEAFLVATKRFAAIAGQTVLVRLPPTELVEALRIPGARPFVSVGAMGRHGWIQIKLGAATREELERLFTAAHGAAMSHRRSAIKKPSRARHIRSKRPG